MKIRMLVEAKNSDGKVDIGTEFSGEGVYRQVIYGDAEPADLECYEKLVELKWAGIDKFEKPTEKSDVAEKAQTSKSGRSKTPRRNTSSRKNDSGVGRQDNDLDTVRDDVRED